MKKALVTILQYVLFLGLGIWIVYHMLHELSHKETQQLIDAIKSINPWYLIPIFFAGFLSHFFRALRWRYLLETVDMKPTVLNTTFAVMIGYITNLAVPRAGEVAKCTVLAKYEKMPAHKMIGTIVAERAFDILCLLIIAVTAFLLQFNVINDYIDARMHRMGEKIHSHEHVVIGVLAAIVLFIVASIIIYRRSRETKFGRFMKEMNHGILSILHMKKRWQFIGYTVLIWLMYVLQIYIGLKSLPATHNLSVFAALVVLVYGSVGMIVTPGGIGLYPFLVAQILAVYTIPDVPAQAFGWIAWAVQTAIIILLGVISLLVIHPYNRKRDAQAGLDTAQDI
jgi:uncharacterized protein (TIRG00374 family)